MAAAASDFRSPHHTHPPYPPQASGAPLLLCTSHFLPQCESPFSQAQCLWPPAPCSWGPHPLHSPESGPGREKEEDAAPWAASTPHPPPCGSVTRFSSLPSSRFLAGHSVGLRRALGLPTFLFPSIYVWLGFTEGLPRWLAQW